MQNVNDNSAFQNGQEENNRPPDVPAEPIQVGSSSPTPQSVGREMDGDTVDRKESVLNPSNGKSYGSKRNPRKSEEVEAPKGVVMELDADTFKVLENRINPSYRGQRFTELQEMVQSGIPLDRITVYEDSVTHERFAPDGELRRLVYASLGLRVPVIVYVVTNARRRAQIEGFQANAKNGQARSNSETRRKVEEAFDDAEFGKLRKSDIARLVLTSHTHVANIMRERILAEKAKQNNVNATEDSSGEGRINDIDVDRDAENVKGDLVLNNLVDAVDVDDDTTSPECRMELKNMLEELQKFSEDEGWVAGATVRSMLELIAKEAKKLAKRKAEVAEFDIGRLKEFRRLHSLKLEDLAKLIGTTHASVSRWLDGKMKISSHYQRAIEETLQLDIADIDEILERGSNA